MYVMTWKEYKEHMDMLLLHDNLSKEEKAEYNKTLKYVQKYGEAYSRFILDALKWLKEKESTWKLVGNINKDEFIENIICSVKRLGV